MGRMKRPEIGTKMYLVCENLYYISGRAGPVLEYCVCECTVNGFFKCGYEEIRLYGANPKGHRSVWYRKLSGIGKKVFYTTKEAAELAKQMSEDYERRWVFIGSADIPMRRTWEKYLSEEE